jgi:hypothetical protein
MTRKLVVEVDAEERACGLECVYLVSGFHVRGMKVTLCKLFHHSFHNATIVRMIDGQPQRCAKCLKAEVKDAET